MKKTVIKRCFCLSKGFTLLELLVVVLIIGVLAAVALPQYQAAVLKTQLAKLHLTVRNLYQNAIEYRLTNGEFPTDFSSFAQIGNVHSSSILNINKDIQCDIWRAGAQIACFYPQSGPSHKVYISYLSTGENFYWKCCWSGENEQIKKACQNYFSAGEYIPNAPDYGFVNEQCIQTSH